MKIFKTKKNRDVTATLVEEVAEGLVYDLVCDGHSHRVTVGLGGGDPLASLKAVAEGQAEQAVKREANKQKLKEAGLGTVPIKAKGVK
jgi:hypothetical protein